MSLGSYGKVITAVITGLIGWATLVVNSSDTSITAPEWIVLATVLATALGVYAVSNAPATTSTKLDEAIELLKGIAAKEEVA